MIGLGVGNHPASIRQGTCRAEGPPKYELNPLVAGQDGTATSTTQLKLDLASITTGNFYIGVNNVNGTIFYTASCGNITG
jgi:hypothetical protein